jgi:SAM-dependent methyltransferase
MTPSPFIVERVAAYRDEARRQSRGAPRALDVAMGRGRHAIALARLGYDTFGVDLKLDVLDDAVQRAAADGLRLRVWCADLTSYPLPLERFDVIVVSRYLQRDLFPALRAAASAGGVVVYETVTTAQRAHRTGPTSPDHLLEPGELRGQFAVPGWEMLFYEETREPEAVARLAARRLS